MANDNVNSSLNKPSGVKTIVTILMLFLLYPVGVIMMFVWMKWPTWVKIITTLVMLYVFFVIIGAVAGVVVQVTDPYGKIFEAQRRQCTAQCENASNATVCMTECLEKLRSPK